MYANNTRDLQGLDRADASPETTRWAARTALERDLLIATAFLEHTDTPATAHQLKRALESWYTDIGHADLYNALNSLTTDHLLEGTTTTPRNHYYLTPGGYHLLETYIDHLQTINNAPSSTTTVTITLEHPITPGDIERAYTKLQTHMEGHR
ncbi:helix-turn-helix transcriptional regulator [Natrialba sp. INN-245]|uniref:helix-turn-helix transcriptional regulator n=1 Tax=Natrialba sp. INN-245 TaxID=2690967 RepID=UPI0013130E64|nr:helix-turn-helix transcriptional regulator [Natrialba sp. INN-245]MWV40060.1 hypothetical protein [Natrialba sp. INN-245]